MDNKELLYKEFCNEISTNLKQTIEDYINEAIELSKDDNNLLIGQDIARITDNIITEFNESNIDSILLDSIKYPITITYEIVSPESIEQGLTEESGFEIHKELLSISEIIQNIKDYGFSQLSDNYISKYDLSRVCIKTIDSVHDRDYIQKGFEKYYTLFFADKTMPIKVIEYILKEIKLYDKVIFR